MTKLSIVIVNWNVRDLLHKCLASLRVATKNITTTLRCSEATATDWRRTAEIYVVDNASTDGSVEMVRAEFPEVILIVNKENKWFPHANNQALKEAKGEYALLLNPDTVVKEDALEKLLGFMANHPETGLIGPKIIYPDGRIQDECARELPSLSGVVFSLFGLKRLFPKNKLFAKEVLGGWDHKTSRYIPAISGSCMLIRTELIKRIGFLDETIPMFYEDIDLCQRVRQAGFKTYYLADAEIIHYAGQSARKQSSRKMIQALEFPAYQRFFTRHYPATALFMFNLILIAGSALRIMFIMPVWLLLSAIGKKSNEFSLETLKKYLIALKIGLS